MLQGVGLTFIGFGRFHGNCNGQIMTIIILTVAACEAAISLALIVQLFNRSKSLDVSVWQAIREPGLPETTFLWMRLNNLPMYLDPSLIRT